MHAALRLDIVVSVYNEEAALPAFHAEVSRAVATLASRGVVARILYVNDGSIDRSGEILDRFADRGGVEVIHLSRNFGHEAAMLAGLDHATADHVAFLDADLQHPPAEIPRAFALASEGWDVVLMQRQESEDESGLRRLLNRVFYRTLDHLARFPVEANVSDFFLIGPPVVEVLQREFRERTRFLRGFVQWVGFRRIVIPYVAAARVAGTSKYHGPRLLALARDASLSFSSAPLRTGFAAALVMFAISMVVAAYSVVGWMVGKPPSGYTTLVLFMTVASAVQFGLMAIQGEYIAQIVDEAKGRPVYLVARRVASRGEAAERRQAA